MPTLQLRFPGGRYHATPWGHHVNEGLVEWPPSPWRLLRALIACGFSSQGWREVPAPARELIEKLAGVLPVYRLPLASAAHSRHFMPVGRFKKPVAKNRTEFQFSATTTQRADLYNHFTEDTTLVFDTWANLGDGTMLINWPCELNEDESTLLSQLSAALGYLGRSESWVETEIVEHVANDWNAMPCQVGEHRGRGWEQVALMAPILPSDYKAWQAEAVKQAESRIKLPKSRKKPSAKDKQRAVEPYPPDLQECLQKDTAWWKRHGWSQPPGSQRVLYWRRSNALEVGVPQRARRRAVEPVTTMLLALTSPTGNRSALPPSTRTLPQAELFHRAIVGRVANGKRVHCPELTGRDDQGRPLQDGHCHAHILPVDLDGDGHLDHLIVHAPMGLEEAAQRAIRTLRRTWTKGGAGDLQLALAGSGDLEVLRSLPARLVQRVEQLLGPPQGARVWVSATPFVPPRFLKRRGANTLQGQVNAELASRGYPPVEYFNIVKPETIALRHYVRRRQRVGPPPPVDVGYAIRLQFTEPMPGPITLGYASHFGLGQFITNET